jgi:hypothetical protein
MKNKSKKPPSISNPSPASKWITPPPPPPSTPVPEFIKEYLDAARPYLEAAYRKRGLEGIPKCENAGNDADPFLMMRRIRVLEAGIKSGHDQFLFKEVDRNLIPGANYAASEREAVREFFVIWLLTMIAKDKSMLADLGLLKLKTKGDLRTAELIEDEPEMMLQALRFQRYRDHPDTKHIIAQEARKMNPDFFLRLGKVLKRPGKGFEAIDCPVRRFLLVAWAEYHPTKNGIMPPLCYFSNEALMECVQLVTGETLDSPDQIRKTWMRLGLRKSKYREVNVEIRHARPVFKWTPT